ncbi:polysaccharide deacetylase family protein [Halalkalibacter kiskunsagensis]|uniref:Polysaccharide deacetylase family protein n=1 Tax=Halalkalibacter kiskunsagensis TaxID=1548599 RepID=A0ABV6KE57_9BACI
MYNFKEKDVLTNVKHRDEKGVVLTFDDGPSKYLDRFLDVLAKEEVGAVFFWQSRLLHHKRSWKRVLEEGHVIGTHAHSHPNLVKLDYNEQMKEINTSKKIIEDITGQQVRYLRPPFGQYNKDTITVASKLKVEMVMWEISSFDWELKHHPNKIVENVTSHVQEGSIVLLHELEQTLHALPTLIKKIKEKGFQFQTL